MTRAGGLATEPGSPRISVLIPCYNLGRYLDEAVDSVLAQSFDDFEILIVDDGSTDPGTRSLLHSYQKPRTSVFRTENRGLAAARNFLIEKARGELLCALDADDRLHPSFFEKATGAFDADPSLTFVSSWIEAFGAEEWTWRQDRCDLRALLSEDTVMTAALVRRDAVVAEGGYDEEMPSPGDEDWDLWIRLVKAGHRGVILPETLFYYRRRPGSMSRECTDGETHLALCRYLMEKHSDAFQEHLPEILLWKARENHGIAREVGELEDRVEGWLEPALKRRQQELRRLESRLEASEVSEKGPGGYGTEEPNRLGKLEAELLRQKQERGWLEQSLVAASAEIDALRSSRSWQVTAPLRLVYGLLLSLRRGGGPP